MIINRIAIFLLSMTLSTMSFGWGADGHRVTGQIAWSYLDQATKEEVEALLGALGEETLAEGATWADRIRSDDRYDWAAPMHYINLPVRWQAYKEESDCPQQGCVVKAIEEFRSQLGNRELARVERAEALLFLAHFIGDLHQPMHTGLREDRGGNDVVVKFFGFDSNLHAVWDTHLPAGFIGDWRAYSARTVQAISAEQIRLWQQSDVEDWLAESHALVHDHAYTDKDRLGTEYFSANVPVVEERLQQAGVRLALTLEAVLAK